MAEIKGWFHIGELIKYINIPRKMGAKSIIVSKGRYKYGKDATLLVLDSNRMYQFDFMLTSICRKI